MSLMVVVSPVPIYSSLNGNTFVDCVTWDDTLVVNKLDATVLIVFLDCRGNKPWQWLVYSKVLK